MTFSREDLIAIMEVFRVESYEHIQKLNTGLLELEKNPKQPSLIDEIFRSAHSLKGAARMMGFIAIENVAHKLEGVLSMARREEIELSPPTIDLLYQGLDAISQIIDALSQGRTENQVPIDAIVNQLTAVIEGFVVEEAAMRPRGEERAVSTIDNQLGPDSKTVTSPAFPGFVETTDTALDTITSAEIAEKTSSKPEPELSTWERRQTSVLNEGTVVGRRKADVLLNESIRVSTQRLDELMNQVGELLTTRIKASQRLVETQAIIDYMEDWSRRCQAEKERMVRLMRAKGKVDTSYSLRFLTENAEGLIAVSSMLHALHRNINEDNMRLSLTVDELEDSVKKARLLPLSVVLETFPRMVRDLAKESGKEVELILEGTETELDKRVMEEMKDPLIHLVRNSIDHGLELPEDRALAGKPRAGVVAVRAMQLGNTVAIEVEDDGAGLDTELIKETALRKGMFQERELETMSEAQIWNMIFTPSLSTSKMITNVSGRGVGMDVVRTNVENLKGLIKVESERGHGTRFTVTLPLTLATTQILLVESCETVYAIPTTAVETTIRVNTQDIFTVAGKTAINYNGSPIALARLADVLELPARDKMVTGDLMSVVIAGSAERRIAFTVERLVGEEQVVVRNLGPYLQQVRNISGATTLGDGRICLVLNLADLTRSAQRQRSQAALQRKSLASESTPVSALVVDDSITTRTLEKNILESVGFAVTTAVDGLDAFRKLRESHFDVVVCDVEMPNMNGFELATKIRSDPQLKEMPFILVTSLESDDDKRRGMEVGANAYLTKSTFDQSNLLETIKRLV